MQYDKHKKAEKIIKAIDKNPEMYLVIHYSCESFYDITDGRTPRITSIAVYNFESAQTDSFSLHKIAERKHINISEIEDKYDQLEKQMLTEFFKYAKEHKEYKWIHWNMRDINYGFKAIENRFLVLGGKPFIINDSNKIDLSRLLIQYYGPGRYIAACLKDRFHITRIANAMMSLLNFAMNMQHLYRHFRRNWVLK